MGPSGQKIELGSAMPAGAEGTGDDRDWAEGDSSGTARMRDEGDDGVEGDSSGTEDGGARTRDDGDCAGVEGDSSGTEDTEARTRDDGDWAGSVGVHLLPAVRVLLAGT